MSQINGIRNGCKDVFHTFLVKNAIFDGQLEIPCIVMETKLPNRLIPFSKSIHSNDYDAWVHFYEDDVCIERLWNKPKTYLPILKKFKGVISPDFSLYRDMPLVMQQWNTYRGRAVAHWLQENGISVIVNIRYGDERTYEFCCAGVEKGGVIAIGSHGCIKLKTERKYFSQGLKYVVETLEPTTIIIYGSAPDEIFVPYKNKGIKILQFDSNFKQSRKAVGS